MTAMELRQALGGLLTLSMFIMLGNMIKKDHFDTINDIDIHPATPDSQQDSPTAIDQNLATVSHIIKRPWNQNGEVLKPCWKTPPLKETEQSNGFIMFSFTNGPEYHISQIANAVVVARYLGATLVLPDIKGSKSGYSMSLGDIYDVQNVLNRLDGLVRVTSRQPPQASNGNPPIVKVPNRVSEDHIVKKVKPIYKSKGIVKIESYLPSVNATFMAGNKKDMDSVACQAMFGTLQLQSEVQEVAESMVQKLQNWSLDSNGPFIAVDLRTKGVGKECQRKDQTGNKICYQGQEIGEFLKKIGFNDGSVIYVTQTKWSSELDALRNIFPRTYTKENVMPEAKKGKFLNTESSEFEKAIDLYICSESDIFVPSTAGPFYANVVGMRIASGRNQTFVPGEITSASAFDYVSPYVSQKSHFAYACFC